jgi:hypothetical protein
MIPPRSSDNKTVGRHVDASVLERLGDAEINGGLQWMFAGQIEVWIGSPYAGMSNITRTDVTTFAEAYAWLHAEACRRYPESSYATEIANAADGRAAASIPADASGAPAKTPSTPGLPNRPAATRAADPAGASSKGGRFWGGLVLATLALGWLGRLSKSPRGERVL